MNPTAYADIKKYVSFV